jgi:hypothetical protein
MAWCGPAAPGEAGQGVDEARHGVAGPGKAWQGVFRQGSAR